MGLLDFINTDESYEYISLKEAIIFLKEKTNSTIQEVAIYLLNKGVPSDLACHTKGSDYKIKETSGKHFSYGVFRPYGRNWAFEYLTNISKSYSCATWGELKNYNPLWEDWGIPLDNDNVTLLEKTYWYRQAFLNLEPIKSLNLFDENLPELNPSLIPMWDENYLNILNADDPDSKEMDFDAFVDDNFLYTKYDESNKPKKLPLYFKNNTFTPQEVACLISGYHPNQVGDNWNKVAWLNLNPEFDEALDFTFSALRGGLFNEIDVDCFVISSDELKSFLNSKDIIIEGFNDNLSTQEPIGCGQPSIQQTEPTIEKLNAEITQLREFFAEKDAEIEKLKKELEKEQGVSFVAWVDQINAEKDVEKLKEQIKQLQDNQLSGQSAKPGLLDLIFDETVQGRYAPDLVYAIKAWESIYINNPKTDSHNNKANTWIKNNTPYTGEQEDSSTRRLREIISPLSEWRDTRKKLLNDK